MEWELNNYIEFNATYIDRVSLLASYIRIAHREKLVHASIYLKFSNHQTISMAIGHRLLTCKYVENTRFQMKFRQKASVLNSLDLVRCKISCFRKSISLAVVSIGLEERCLLKQKWRITARKMLFQDIEHLFTTTRQVVVVYCDLFVWSVTFILVQGIYAEIFWLRLLMDYSSAMGSLPNPCTARLADSERNC